MSSLPRGTGKASVASVNRANFLFQSFIGFLCKPRNISLFLSSVFLSTIFFPYLSLNHPLTPFFLQVPLDPAGAGPGQLFKKLSIQFLYSVRSVQLLGHAWLFLTSWTAAGPSLSITNSQVHPNPCPLSQWCHPTISSSVIPFSSCLSLSQHQGIFQFFEKNYVFQDTQN